MIEINRVYGSNVKQIGSLHMCGGCAAWWDYQLHFDSEGKYQLYKSSSKGTHHIGGELYYNEETEEIRRHNGICDDGQNRALENEIVVDYDFFVWD